MKPMRIKKRWIITSGVAALLLAAGGVSMLTGIAHAPMTNEETIKLSEQKFGKPSPMPTSDDLKTQLAQVEATMRAKPSDAPADDDWQKAELLKQQITFAEHAPSPMPTGHMSTVVAGKQP